MPINGLQVGDRSMMDCPFLPRGWSHDGCGSCYGAGQIEVILEQSSLRMPVFGLMQQESIWYFSQPDNRHLGWRITTDIDGNVTQLDYQNRAATDTVFDFRLRDNISHTFRVHIACPDCGDDLANSFINSSNERSTTVTLVFNCCSTFVLEFINNGIDITRQSYEIRAFNSLVERRRQFWRNIILEYYPDIDFDCDINMFYIEHMHELESKVRAAILGLANFEARERDNAD